MEDVQRNLRVGRSGDDPRVVDVSLLLVRGTRLDRLVKLLASIKVDPRNADGFKSAVGESNVGGSSAVERPKARKGCQLSNGDQVGSGVPPGASGVVDDGAIVISRKRVEDGESDIGVDNPGMTDVGLLIVLGVGCERLVQLELAIKVDPIDFDFDVQVIDESDVSGRAAVDGFEAGLELRWVGDKVLLEKMNKNVRGNFRMSGKCLQP